MPIDKNHYETIIKDLNIGNSVAEHDVLLESARVETPVFSDVLNDRYDIIFGRKGAGKTAIFKIINILSNFLLMQRNIVILSGVNSEGESIFNEFTKQFANFSEKNFEKFWKFYFISLIYNDFLKNEKYQAKLSSCGDEVKQFIDECRKAGIPEIPAKQEKSQIIRWILEILNTKVKRVKVNMMVDTTKPNVLALIPEVELDNTISKKEERDSVYVNDIGKALKKILQKSGFKIWIILDRLDEVFCRYSSVEFNGLRGLLLAYKSFVIDSESDVFRIKLFLRDDIIEFLTNNKIYKKHFKGKNIPPLPAATHIFARKSPTLNWTEDEIEQLILNRLIVNKDIRKYLNLNEKMNEGEISENEKRNLRVKKFRLEIWNKIFPKTISTSTSLKWICTRLKDANGIITPRSVIDMLEGAINYQRKRMSTNLQDYEQIFPVDSIKEGLIIASKNKLENDIYNEFPKEQENIKKLSKEGKIKLTKKDLQKIYGKDWEDTVSTLNRMGIIRYVKYN